MSIARFFDKRTKQSDIKSRIVAKYFAAWANVLTNQQLKHGKSPQQVRIGYVDVFAGPGRYQDGSPSTPLKILQHAVSNGLVAKSLTCQFNDENPDYANTLQLEIDNFQGISNLRVRPQVTNIGVADSVVPQFTALGRQCPTLYFFDPWGYKGLTLKLIEAAITPFGCDCIFFFNVKRVNAAIRNERFAGHVDALFSPGIAAKLREEWELALKPERAELIIRHLKEALKTVGGKFNREFRVSNDRGKISHFLILTSKSNLAYTIINDVMAGESALTSEGVPTFDYHPSGSLFAAATINELEQQLLNDFKGQTVRFERLFQTHHLGKDFTAANYREAIERLESKKMIAVVPPLQQRLKGDKITCGPRVEITFP